MSRARILFLLPFFFMEIRLHASSEHMPAGDCWGKTVPCAIRAEGSRRELTAKGLSAVVGDGGLVEQRDGGKIQLVRGQSFWKVKDSGVVFSTPYASFVCDGECAGIFEREDVEITLKAIAGRWIVKRAGERARPYQIIAGWQVAVSEVTGEGVAEMEFPQSLPWAQTVKQWSRLYAGTVAQFKAEVRQFREEWRQGVEAASQLHSVTAGRAIASHEAALAAERARQKSREREDERLRALFRSRSGLD